MRRLPAPRRPLAAMVVALVALAGCSSPHPAAPIASTASSSAACGPAAHEVLDPRSTSHLFPGAAEPIYLSDPPTSGPHRLGPPPTGAIKTAIPRARQVAMLETGFVIVQYQGLSPADVATLDGLAGSLVTVAPAVGHLPDHVVATAWTWKQVCRSVTQVSMTSLQAFIAARRGKGFSHS
jgi:hypothetical protein